ncbi:MAG: NIL domain-containing protein [candidate division NC10 bacterium]|nr:NIL domain-containing protein [candidate division NC10 bacterium]
MPTRRVTLTFPQTLVTEPVIWRVSKEFGLVPNIRKARITEQAGEVVLDFTGTAEALDRGLAYIRSLGIRVTG